VVTGFVVPSGLPASAILSNLDGRFAIHAQSFDTAIIQFLVVIVDVVKDIIGLGKFFLGFALTTFLSR